MDCLLAIKMLTFTPVRNSNTVKLGNKELFDKEQIGIKEPFPVTNFPVYFIRIRNIWH